MPPWIARPSLDIDLDKTVGELDIPSEAIASSRRILSWLAMQMPPRALRLAHLIRLRTANRFHREVVNMARIAGADWRELVIANLTYDWVMAIFSCSTIALPTSEGPVLARNMDFWPEDLLARASYLMRYNRGGRQLFMSAGWPGAVGIVTGMSSRGFAVALNAVSCPEKRCLTGYPVLLHLRRVVEDAANFDSALKMLTKQRLMSPALFTLVGSENHERVVIERSQRRHALRRPTGDERLVATNDYRLLFQAKPETATAQQAAQAEFFKTTCHRYDTLCSEFAGWTPDKSIDDARLLYALSGPNVIQSITAQHIVMRPRTQEASLHVPRRFMEGLEE